MSYTKELRRGIYMHYESKFYAVHEQVKHADTLEEYVVYSSMGAADPELWICSRADFEGEVQVPRKQTVPRFQFIEGFPEDEEEEDEEEEDEEEDSELDNEPELFTLFDERTRLNQATMALDKAGLSYEVETHILEPRPAHMSSNQLFKIFLRSGDFEAATIALRR